MSVTPSQAGFQIADAMEPIGFEGLFGWLHHPPLLGVEQYGTPEVGVLICAPLGRDARCAHLPMRVFAERLAAAGVPTLRYDHADTGDSLDIAPDTDLTPEWLCGIAKAVGVLRVRTGVRRVVLAGVRLGASFAAMAQGADGLILLAPVISGRSWVRKLRFSAAAGAGAQRPGGDDAALDTDGLHLWPATAQSLAKLDLLQTAPSAAKVMLASRSKITDPYARHLVAAGVDLTEMDFPGYDDLFLDAHSNVAPTEVFDRALAWLQRSFTISETDASPSVDIGLRAMAAKPLAVESDVAHDGAMEQPIRFGADLHGLLCRPVAPAADGSAVLFCNTGGDPRAGLGRFATDAARRLARQGVASLRFDFAGLGDSPMPSGDLRSHVYETSREADLTAAVDTMRERGYDRVYTIGVCAGAYHALQAALSDPRISGAFAISPAKLIWREGDSLDPDRIDEGRATRSYLEQLRDRRTWVRLLRGEVDVRTVTCHLASRAWVRVKLWRDDRGRQLRADMAKLSARGGRVCLLMGVDDASLDEVETYFGPLGAKLTGLSGLSIEVRPGLDHGLARRRSRETAMQMLLDWVGQVPQQVQD